MTDELHELSPAQRRIWYAEQRGGTEATYVIESSSWLTGALDAGRLDDALNALIQRHPVLGTQVVAHEDGYPRLRAVAQPVRVERFDAVGHTPADRTADALRIAERVVGEPFGLHDGPLTRCALIRLSDREHLLVFAYHHLLGDAISSRLIRRDLLRLYADGGKRGGCGAADADRALHDADLVKEPGDRNAERRAIDAQATARRLTDTSRESTFRAANHDAPHKSPRAHWCQAVIDSELDERVRLLAHGLRATSFIVHLTALHLLIQRYSGQDQTLAGFMTANRAGADRAKVGLYAQTLVSRFDGTGNSTGADAIRCVRKDVIEATRHEGAELEEVLRLLPEGGAHGAHPLFQCMLSHIDLGQEMTVGGLTATPVIVPLRFAWLDAEFRMYPDAAGGTRIVLRCPEELYDLETADQLLRHYLQLLQSLTAGPETPVASLAVMTPEESARVLELGIGAPARERGTVASLLADRLSASPCDDIAVSFADERLTFGELRQSAWRVADFLRSHGAGPGDVVAVCVPRSLDLVVAVTGVLLGGAAVLPIDPELPAERQRFMVENLAPTLLLASEPDSTGQAVVTVGDAVRLGGREPPGQLPTATQLAYLIYTSGSTGAPKPVGNTQVGLANRLAWMQEQFPIGPGDAVLHKTPVSFDVSVWELTWPLLTGARMVLARPGGHRDPYYLGELIRAERVTVVHFVPSMLAAFLAAGLAEEPLPLRYLFLSGEALPGSLARALMVGCAAEVHNLYGPTEAAIDVTSFACRKEPIGAAVPIGRPVPGSRIHVLNRGGHVQPPGAVGELYLGGVQLAAGYIGHEQMTSERFAPHLAGVDERFYRTGDLGVMRRDGVVTYIGRADRQVKIRGFRVEPGEIEGALEQLEGVQQAAVIASETQGRKELVAFVRTQADTLDARAIAVQLARTLPEYMIPASVHLVDSFPTTTSGKADYAELRQEDARRTAQRPHESHRHDREPDAPLDEVSATLLGIMRGVLGIGGFDVDDSFFAHGGDSIRSLDVVAQAKAAGLALSVEDLFHHPTVRQLGAMIGPAGKADDDLPEPFSLIDDQARAQLPAATEDAYPLSTALRGLVVESSRPSRYRVYLTTLRIRGELNVARLRRACVRVMERHPVLRSSLWRAEGSAEVGIQVVHRDVPDPVRVRDLRGRSAARQNWDFEEWFSVERCRPFDWYRPPLVRLTAHLLSDDEFRLTLAEPMLDGMSAALFLTELLDQYLSPGVVAAPENAWPTFLRGERHARATAAQVWRDLLRDAPDTAIPGLDPDAGEPAMTTITVEFPPAVVDMLYAVNRQTGLPMKALLLAAHTRVLTVLTHQREVVTGVMTNGRPASGQGVEGIGLFINVNALPARVGPGSWLDLARQLHELEVRMMPHRAFPFTEVRRQRMVGQVHALFNYTHFHPYERFYRSGELRILSRQATDQTYFALTAQFMAREHRLDLSLEFFGAAVSADTQGAIAGMYQAAVTELARTPHQPHDRVCMAVGGMRAVLSGKPSAPSGTLGRAFLRTAERCPDRVAVRSASKELTFAEVRGLARRFARILGEAGARRGDVVGVQLLRSEMTAIAQLAILIMGGICLPIDEALPLARRRQMIRDSGCRFVVADPAPELADLALVIAPRTADAAGGNCTENDGWGSRADGETVPDDPAYLVFTSGSTGEPKGVLLSHGAILNRLRWGWRTAPLNEQDVLAVRTPAAFVDAIAELLNGMLGGATSYLVPEQGKSPERLLEHLERAGVTRVTLVPTLLKHLLATCDDLGARIPALSRWHMSGEPLPLPLVRQLLTQLPTAHIVNLYGTTEVTADVTAHLTSGDEQGATAPIGVPIDGCTVAVLDPWEQMVPVGIIGELAVSGSPVSLGYLGASGDRHPSVWFRTGDLGMVDPNGSLRCLGRRDRQLKVRGVRLESAEIESVLASVAGVAQAVVVKQSDENLAAFVMLRDGVASVEAAALRRAVLDRLPAAALPASFALVPSLPLTVSGKVDYVRLREVGTPLAATAPTGEAKTLVQRELAALWRSLLGVESVKLESDFLELGGNSMHAVMLAASVRDRMGAALDIGEIFRASRLIDQAELVKGKLLRLAAAEEKGCDSPWS